MLAANEHPTLYRFITRSCCDRDWGHPTCSEVFSRCASDRLLQKFRQGPLAPVFQDPANRMDRRRDLPHGRPSPGPAEIRKLKLQGAGLRGWLWKDGGERLDPDGIGTPIVWLIAKGARSRGARGRDLQDTHSDILWDPNDAWQPDDEDYAQHFEHRVQTWEERMKEQLSAAVATAMRRPNELIPVDIDRVESSVLRYLETDLDVTGAVIDTLEGTFFLLPHTYRNGEKIPWPVVLRLAAVVFPDAGETLATASSLPIEGLQFDAGQYHCLTADP